MFLKTSVPSICKGLQVNETISSGSKDSKSGFNVQAHIRLFKPETGPNCQYGTRVVTMLDKFILKKPVAEYNSKESCNSEGGVGEGGVLPSTYCVPIKVTS